MTDHLAESDSDSDRDVVLMQFNRLIEELLSGKLNRTTFRPWEIGILVDLATCQLPATYRWKTILRDYQSTVQHRMRAGAQLPLKLSEYLELSQANREPAPLAPKRAATPSRIPAMTPSKRWRSIER